MTRYDDPRRNARDERAGTCAGAAGEIPRESAAHRLRARVAELEKQNAGLVRYCDKITGERFDAERRAATDFNARVRAENLLAETKWKLCCWRSGALVMLAADLLFLLAEMLSEGGAR